MGYRIDENGQKWTEMDTRMSYERSGPMWFTAGAMSKQRETHFDDGDCRTCGGACQKPELAREQADEAKRRTEGQRALPEPKMHRRIG